MTNGRERYAGLGGYPDISLAEAREQAQTCRQLRDKDIDPIEHRKEASRQPDTDCHTFMQVANEYIEAHQTGWKNTKHVAQWHSTLKTYAEPVFGDKDINNVTGEDVLRILTPIWSTKNETASRVRGRIENIIDYATARGYRQGENPARWRGHLIHLLPKRKSVKTVTHHPALDYEDLPEFMTELRKQVGISASALEFAILTAARTGEVINARWNEFDDDVWSIPAERMKARKEHRVPLSAPTLEILDQLSQVREGDYVFRSSNLVKPISNMAMLQLLKRMNYAHITVHGFRSTFRDWCAEKTNAPREVAEMALAHVIENKVEAAYRRGDLFERRQQLMNVWANYCAGTIASNIVEMRHG
jgi:integrase